MTEKLSERIKQAEKTGKLDLSNAFLTDVPNEVLAITNLRSLNLNRNPLKVRAQFPFLRRSPSARPFPSK